ncbi:cell division protein FtsB, partial [Methylorubrum rhodinum]
MGRKKHTAEEIVAKLRQVDVLVSQGRKVAEAIRSIEVTEVTYYRWRSEYGGLKGDQVKRLKSLETENQRLRRAISDLTDPPPWEWSALRYGLRARTRTDRWERSGTSRR